MTWDGARPVKFFGSRIETISSFLRLNSGSATMRSIRSFSPPSSLTTRGRRLGVNAQLLVQHLAVAALFDRGHHDVLGGHERQLTHDALMDDLRVNHQAIADIEHDA